MKLITCSGSPKVLKQVIISLLSKGYEIDLITNKTEGFLTNIYGLNYKYINYKWYNNNKLKTLFSYFSSQLQIFYKIIFCYSKHNSIIYINTITPIGAAMACKIQNFELIYHVHEKYLNSNLLHKLCDYVYEKSSGVSIFVSKYLKDSYKNEFHNAIVIYNSLEKSFKIEANNFLKNRPNNPDTILMVCSLRDFKGIYEFVELSKHLINYKFELVLSATKEEVDCFIEEVNPGNNIQIFNNQTNLHSFYQRAKILLNLSKPEQWIETFGLTILEGLEYGIPAIVPNVGGPIELITNDHNGFLINSFDIKTIIEKINILMNDNLKYIEFSNNALIKSKEFDNDKMSNQIIGLLQKYN